MSRFWLRGNARRFGIAAGLLGTLVVLAAVSSSAPHRRAAPPLPASAIQGGRLTLATLHGKPALIDFFASWCGPCVAEAPALRAAERALRGRATVVAVAWSDNAGSAASFARRFGWSFPVLTDPQGAAGYAYGIQGLPSGFVLDATGHVVDRLIGPEPATWLIAAVDHAG